MLLAARASVPASYALAEAKFFECQHLALLGLDIRQFVGLVQECGYDKLIVLERRNYLRKVVSSKLGAERGRFHFETNEVVPLTKVRLDMDRVSILGKEAPIVELFDYMDQQYRTLREELKSKDVLELNYEEDILTVPTVAYSKVIDWLGVDSRSVQVTLRRTNTQKLSEVMENRADVQRTLEPTKYAWMLDSDA